MDNIGAGNKTSLLFMQNESNEIINGLQLTTYESVYKIMIWLQKKKEHYSANKLLKYSKNLDKTLLFW